MSVFLSPANVVCDVVFFDSVCDFVKPQTFSLTRQREAIVMEGETKMNFERSTVKLAPAIRRRVTPQRHLHRKAHLCKIRAAKGGDSNGN